MRYLYNATHLRMLCVQTGEGWNAGVMPKAMGGRHLDTASRQLPHLEHFVMFSSIVASAGNEGTTSTCDMSFQTLQYIDAEIFASISNPTHQVGREGWKGGGDVSSWYCKVDDRSKGSGSTEHKARMGFQKRQSTLHTPVL